MQWIIENKEWLFSGIGITIVSWVLSKVFKKKNTKPNKTVMKQTSGHSSTNIQASGDITLHNYKNVKR
jgi:hypothetical protein